MDRRSIPADDALAHDDGVSVLRSFAHYDFAARNFAEFPVEHGKQREQPPMIAPVLTGPRSRADSIVVNYAKIGRLGCER